MPTVKIRVDCPVINVDRVWLAGALSRLLESEGHPNGRLSVALIDNRAIHELNIRYLQHDYETDVLSFLLSEPGEVLEGELIVSSEMAVQRAPEFNWPPLAELLLYCVHGALHLCGYDDHLPADRQSMEARQFEVLAGLGFASSAEQRAQPR